MSRRAPALLLAAALAGAAACSGGSGAASSSAPATTAAPGPAAAPTVAPTTTAATTTVAPTTTARPLPALPVDGTARAIVTRSGVTAAVVGAAPGGGWRVTAPCSDTVTVRDATPISGAHVVLDPGHGGADEPGAQGPRGVVEATVNLDVARRVQRALEARGVVVVLARTGDYRSTLASRAAIAKALDAKAFVSIHHNAEPDERRATPGSEVYYQLAAGPDGRNESKRLAGLIYEEVVRALSAYSISWAADFDAGVKTRPGSNGGDYYGILRNAAGVPSALAELAFLSNPDEEALLATEAFRQVEADAVARGVLRFLTTDDAGSGFVDAYPRLAPAGGGGGTTGCVNPRLD